MWICRRFAPSGSSSRLSVRKTVEWYSDSQEWLDEVTSDQYGQQNDLKYAERTETL